MEACGRGRRLLPVKVAAGGLRLLCAEAEAKSDPARQDRAVVGEEEVEVERASVGTVELSTGSLQFISLVSLSELSALLAQLSGFVRSMASEQILMPFMAG